MTGDAHSQPFVVRPMTPAEVADVARLHREGIDSGFLSSLGVEFLKQLYAGIAATGSGFVFVAEASGGRDVGGGGRVVGFVAGAEHVGRLYRGVLMRRGVMMLAPLARRLLRPATLRRIAGSVFYPSRSRHAAVGVPDAELLSIAVAPEARGSGVAGVLVDALVAEFQRRGVRAFKLVVGSRLERARRFYQKYGFRPAGTIESHGDPSEVYVLDVPDAARLPDRADRGAD